ncbi:uncharacterized protein RCC_09492 [Ramularia collo-cygni]|uniref:Uncharacterized protein n=1 Tax=Ramularia collo-cygni TaxID=112498 RepID=A0A2D3VPD2_9PEZI|nr:uncharacterized protein RCC_09492 [Ramularia collo-cygni]CZT23778.1 uncharacterized protein RCC_09492 [Ramularia collo-cygni]
MRFSPTASNRSHTAKQPSRQRRKTELKRKKSRLDALTHGRVAGGSAREGRVYEDDADDKMEERSDIKNMEE